jgi:hypothetical protein
MLARRSDAGAPCNNPDDADRSRMAPQPAGDHLDTRRGELRALVGLAAISFSIIYILSDLIELAQGGFSPVQLALTYAAEATLPLFVLGLYALQRPQIGRLGLIGAVGYAYSYVAFTATVVYSFVEHTPDWVALTRRLGLWFLVHGVIMVAAGLCFGLAVVRAAVLPRWTGYALMAGVCLVAATTDLSDPVRTAAAAVRAAAFVGMGLAILRLPDPPTETRPAPDAATSPAEQP